MSKPELVIHAAPNVAYLPNPNLVEVVLCEELAPIHLTRTAFLIPITEDGGFVMARNKRRGLEIAGGHIEDGETPLQAAIRETREETGYVVNEVEPLGFLRMTSEGSVPDDWAYPHPLSYQQFFVGVVTGCDAYLPNDECDHPEIITDLLDDRITVGTSRYFLGAARAKYLVRLASR